MKRIALLAACVSILLLAAATPALAQSAVLCGCYCGITISPPCSEQACKAACGWRSGDGSRGGDGGGSTQLWYCRALGRNNGYGWAWSPNQNWARQRALSECQERTRGCVIEACRINDPSLANAPPKSRARSTARGARGKSQTRAEQGWCELCTRKLRNDVNSGWASALIRSYVGQAIAGYQNCKRMGGGTGGACPVGDQLVSRLRACSIRTFSAYRECISNSLQ
jgi:hypothetical protein